MSPPFRQGRGTQRMRSFRGSYGNRGSGAALRSSDEVPVVGLDLPCGAGHLGLQCAPGTSQSALGFESRLIKMQKKGPNGPFFLHGAGGGTRTHTMSPSADFESATSTIPSHRRAAAKYISFLRRIQVFPSDQGKHTISLLTVITRSCDDSQEVFLWRSFHNNEYIPTSRYKYVTREENTNSR